MGKLIAESWFGRGGLAKGRDSKKGGAEPEKAAIGVLAFEVGSLMSKTISLWHSLRDKQVARLRYEVLRLDGVRKLVSDDDDFLLGLALAEILDSLNFLSRSVARLGKRCADPLLQRFEHVFGDLIKEDADVFGWEYAVRKMERKVKKMERLVAASANLYRELEVLAELEQGLRRMQGSTDPSRQAGLLEAKHRVIWQRQEVKCLREASLWNRTYEYAVGLLARSLFTIAGRIWSIFGLHHNEGADGTAANSRITNPLHRSRSVSGVLHHSGHPSDCSRMARFSSGPLVMSSMRSGPIAVAERVISEHSLPRSALPPRPGKHHNPRTKWLVSGPFKGCMATGNDSPVLQSCITVGSRSLSSVSRLHHGTKDVSFHAHFQVNFFSKNISLSVFESKHKLLNAPPGTLGSAGLALHYANIIILIEKLAASPHLIGPDARDDLYGMLTTSIRAALRARLKTYAKNLASSVYDPVLAAEWSEALMRILEWLTPLAHNMIRWQTERNFEQQHLVSCTNILLLQTLYFANQLKTEAAITELLVGLNYLWRFGRELNAKAILECLSDRNFDNYLNSMNQCTVQHA